MYPGSGQNSNMPVLPEGEIFSAEQIINSATLYVSDREADEREAVLPYLSLPRSRRSSLNSGSRLRRGSRFEPERASHERKANRRQRWEKIPRRQVLYEGNFQDWLEIMSCMLRKLGIWGSSNKPKISPATFEAERFASDDSWVVSIMLMHVNPHFLTRLPIDQQVSSCELLSILTMATKPFRFGDLPAELRQRVIQCMVPVNQEYDEMSLIYRDWHYEGMDKGKSISCLAPIRLAAVRHLCGVSKEFRNEVSKIHYSCNTFISRTSFSEGPEIIEEWANVMGKQHLRHLRDLKVTFGFYKDMYDTFRVTFDAENGLKVEVEPDEGTFDPKAQKLLAHLATTKERAQRGVHSDTGVVSFFTANPDGVRSILYSPAYRPFERDSDEEDSLDEPFDERNAYSVAYGERYVGPRECPW